MLAKKRSHSPPCHRVLRRDSEAPSSFGVLLMHAWHFGAVIVESTYGVSRHEERLTREARLTSKVREIIARGGRVLMPVVALGRAQVSARPMNRRALSVRRVC